MILYIDACVRRDSRTQRLAEALLQQLDDEVQQVRLEDIPFGISDEAFLDQREKLTEEGAYDHEMFALARQFAAADTIVIAAPYWDLSFPATLKQYMEKVTVNGITDSRLIKATGLDIIGADVEMILEQCIEREIRGMDR